MIASPAKLCILARSLFKEPGKLRSFHKTDKVGLNGSIGLVSAQRKAETVWAYGIVLINLNESSLQLA